MKIAKKKVRIQSFLVNPIINLERPLEKVLKKGQYIAIKCHYTPGDNDSGSYEINIPYYGGGLPGEWLVWKDRLLKALDGKSISTVPLQHTFTERLLSGDAKATFNQFAMDIGICTDNFNKVLLEMTKHAFPAYAFCKQKRYLHRHQVKSRTIKLYCFISRLQELNVDLEEFLTDTEGQETAPLPIDEIMDIIYHSMPTTWKTMMIEQDFNYEDSTIKEMTDFFESRVENLELKGEKKKYPAAAKKTSKKSAMKRKREDSDSSVIESSKESSVERRPLLHPTW